MVKIFEVHIKSPENDNVYFMPTVPRIGELVDLGNSGWDRYEVIDVICSFYKNKRELKGITIIVENME